MFKARLNNMRQILDKSESEWESSPRSYASRQQANNQLNSIQVAKHETQPHPSQLSCVCVCVCACVHV